MLMVIARALVDNPDDVKVTEKEDETEPSHDTQYFTSEHIARDVQSKDIFIPT